MNSVSCFIIWPCHTPLFPLQSLTDILLQSNALTHLTAKWNVSRPHASPFCIKIHPSSSSSYHFLHEATPTIQVQPAVQILRPLHCTKHPVFKKYCMSLLQTPPSYKHILSSFRGLAYRRSLIHISSLSFLGPKKVQMILTTFAEQACNQQRMGKDRGNYI